MAAKLKKIDRLDRLVALASQECSDAGITLIFKKTEEDPKEGNTIGSFSAVSKELVVVMEGTDWITTLAHELSHLRQWREGQFKSEDEYELYEKWLVGDIELDMAKVIKCTRYAQNCELDAEQRTVELMKSLKLLTAAQRRRYIRRANCYVLLYEVARRHRFWPRPGHSPVQKREIYNLLPDSFILDPSQIPDDFEAAVVDKCFG